MTSLRKEPPTNDKKQANGQMIAHGRAAIMRRAIRLSGLAKEGMSPDGLPGREREIIESLAFEPAFEKAPDDEKALVVYQMLRFRTMRLEEAATMARLSALIFREIDAPEEFRAAAREIREAERAEAEAKERGAVTDSNVQAGFLLFRHSREIMLRMKYDEYMGLLDDGLAGIDGDIAEKARMALKATCGYSTAVEAMEAMRILKWISEKMLKRMGLPQAIIEVTRLWQALRIEKADNVLLSAGLLALVALHEKTDFEGNRTDAVITAVKSINR